MTASTRTADLPAEPATRFHRMDTVVFAVALLFNAAFVGTPALWRDEVVTALLAQRGPSGIVELSRNIDAVHAPYYLFQWAWTAIFGTSEFALRFPSAVAMAVAVTTLGILARHYLGRNWALVSVAIFLILPSTTRYAQEARSTAFIVAGVVVATVLLHIAVESPSRRTPWIAYVLTLVLVAVLGFTAMVILLPHAVFLLGRRIPLGTVATVVAGPALTGLGVALIASTQQSALSWVPAPTVSRFVDGLGELFGSRPIAVLFALAFIAFVALGWKSHQLRSTAWLVIVAALPMLFWLVSQISNIYVPRYFLFTVPFFVLMACSALARGHIIWLVAFAAAALALSLPNQMQSRSSAGHFDDFRSAENYVAVSAEPGDAITFDYGPTRAGYAYYLNKSTDNLVLADPLVESEAQNLATFGNLSVRCDEYSLSAFDRVWSVYITGLQNSASQTPASCDQSLEPTSSRSFGTLTVQLFERQ